MSVARLGRFPVKCLYRTTGQIPGQMSVLCDWADSQVKCLCCMTGQIPRLNVCVAQLGRFPGQMSVSCNWVERPRDSMIMDNTHKVNSYGCAVPRSNVSLVQLGHAATWHTHTYIHTKHTHTRNNPGECHASDRPLQVSRSEVGEGKEGGGKATEVHKKVMDGAEDSGRRQIVVTVIANGVND